MNTPVINTQQPIYGIINHRSANPINTATQGTRINIIYIYITFYHFPSITKLFIYIFFTTFVKFLKQSEWNQKQISRTFSKQSAMTSATTCRQAPFCRLKLNLRHATMCHDQRSPKYITPSKRRDMS